MGVGTGDPSEDVMLVETALMIEPPPRNRVVQPSPGLLVTVKLTRSATVVVIVRSNVAVPPGSTVTDGYGVVIVNPTAAATDSGIAPTSRAEIARQVPSKRCIRLLDGCRRRYERRSDSFVWTVTGPSADSRAGQFLYRPPRWARVLRRNDCRPSIATRQLPDDIFFIPAQLARYARPRRAASSISVRTAAPCGPFGEKARSSSYQAVLAISRCAHSVDCSRPASMKTAPLIALPSRPALLRRSATSPLTLSRYSSATGIGQRRSPAASPARRTAS